MACSTGKPRDSLSGIMFSFLLPVTNRCVCEHCRERQDIASAKWEALLRSRRHRGAVHQMRGDLQVKHRRTCMHTNDTPACS